MSCAAETKRVVDRGKAAPVRVVLLCSRRRGQALVDLVTELDVRALDFDLIAGVDEDSALAVAAMQRYGQGALYVICRDEDLDYYGSQHLVRAFEQAAILPDQYVVTITLRSDRVESLAEMITLRARRLEDGTEVLAANEPPASVDPVAAANIDPRASREPLVFHDPELAPRRRSWTLGVSAAGLGLLAFMTIQFAASSDADRGAVSVATAAGPTPEERVAQVREKLEAEARAKAQAEAEAREAALALEAANDAAYAEERAAAARAAAEEPASEDDADALVLDDGEPDDTDAAREAEAQRISAALRKRRFRALDTLIIDPQRSGRMNLAAARAHCAQLESGQVGGWRLPTLAEASAVARAGLIRRDDYWTDTLGDSSTRRQLVFDSRRRRIKSQSPRWRGARAVCVRERQAAPSSESSSDSLE